jgi:fumarate hydratase class II
VGAPALRTVHFARGYEAPEVRVTDRIERDSLGSVQVPEHAPWGAQTQRAIGNFRVPTPMPVALISALLHIKRATAQANRDHGALDELRCARIDEAARELLESGFEGMFPLSVFQSGSGTQTHTNVNEVLARRASTEASPVHPNDHVNASQSTNDVFPTAIRLAVLIGWRDRLNPAVDGLLAALDAKAFAFDGFVKIGRTHLMDATPIRLGSEFSAWAGQIRLARRAMGASAELLAELPLGGTAVGTGLNAPLGYPHTAVAHLARITGLPLVPAALPGVHMGGQEALVQASASMRTLAVALHKLANDVRWMASGPRSGLGEITFPANEPGSSIMPGKVNPTQAEALAMAAAAVFGNDATVAFAGSSGNFELNVMLPVIAHRLLDAIDVLDGTIRGFTEQCVVGIEPVPARLAELTARSLMLVTALNPHLGYDRAARIAKHAWQHDLTLEQAAVALGELTAERFRELVQASAMLGPRE